MSWFKKIAWEEKNLIDNIIAAFSLDPRSKTHRMGELVAGKPNDQHKHYVDFDGIVSSEMTFHNKRISDRNIEVVVSIKFKNPIIGNITLYERKLIEETPFNRAVTTGFDDAKPVKVASENLSWNQNDLKLIPADIVNATYRLIDGHFGFGGDGDDESPVVPSPEDSLINV